MALQVDRRQLRELWERALIEDGFDRDISSLAAVDEGLRGTGRVVGREAGTFAGDALFDLLRDLFAGQVNVREFVHDGDRFEAGTVVGDLSGPVRLLLSVERTLLNFLQRLCGVATLTRRYVDAVAGTVAGIYDTRKTIPGWRQLDKYAVRCGGGRNHRMGLHGAILVKDNHLTGFEPGRLASAVFDMLNRAAGFNPPPDFIEIEVDTPAQLEELFKVVGIDVILLDNFTPEQVRDAVARRDALGLKGKVALEASGGVDMSSVRALAEAGADRIAIGAITHSAPALDMAMDLDIER